ncbi:MAG TPA: hypothetical protein VMT03_06990 [Polyangia bacterium]|nr:hypothetical protein [Polyangia bacterium]
MLSINIEQVGGFSPKQTSRDINLHVSFTNASTEPVVVNSRGIVAGQESPDFIRDITIRIADEESGKIAAFDCLPNVAPLRAENFRVLGPGDSLRIDRNLGCFVLKKGRYFVTATVDAPPPSGLSLRGIRFAELPVVSNRLAVEIR